MRIIATRYPSCYFYLSAEHHLVNETHNLTYSLALFGSGLSSLGGIKMKKLSYISTIVLIVISIYIVTNAQDSKYKIGVFFWHDSPNDYMAYEGIKDGFKTARFDCEFGIFNALGDEAGAHEIIQKLSKQKPDLIYAMGTGATKRLMKVIKDTPIVFTAVTNPVQSGITPNWKTSGRNIAGNSNWIPTDKVLSDFKEVVPALKSLGVMYDPGNAVSSMEVKVARKAVDTLGLKLIEVEVWKIDDLAPAAKSLVAKKVEAVWVPIDILVYKNLDKMRVITNRAKLPLVSSSYRGVKDGAIFGEIVDYYTLGKLSVPIALKILDQNIDPKDRVEGTKYHIQFKRVKEKMRV